MLNRAHKVWSCCPALLPLLVDSLNQDERHVTLALYKFHGSPSIPNICHRPPFEVQNYESHFKNFGIAFFIQNNISKIRTIIINPFFLAKMLIIF